MTKFQPQYFIVCILTASMWASLGRSSNGDSVGELEREGAGIDQKVETPNLENDNLRLKIDVFKETLTDLRTETNNNEDNLDEERDRPVQAAEDKSASIAELEVGFERALNEIKVELKAIREELGHVRNLALPDDVDDNSAEVHAQPEIHEHIKQHFDLMQVLVPERIEGWLRVQFPNTDNTYGLGIASKLIFWMATMLSLVVVYAIAKTALVAVAHAGRIGFAIGFCGLASILSGVYLVVGVPFVCIGFVIILVQSLKQLQLQHFRLSRQSIRRVILGSNS